MKSIKWFFLEVYWVALFTLISYLSLKFLGWYHSFNIIIFYLISFWLLYYNYKTFFQNISLTKSSYSFHKTLNKESNLKFYWFIFRTVVIFIFMFNYFYINLIDIYSIWYEGFKIIGLIAFLGFVIVNYYRLSIMYLSNI
jgi:hypothetical protein